jgi:hypothetical protein
MSPVVTPTPPEILGWMRGFAADYLDPEMNHALTETARDHAGLALVNFNMHVMARGETGAERFLGVDRPRIARAILEAPLDDLADWESRIEEADPLWKRGLCVNLNVVAESMRRGALGTIGIGLIPAWAGALLASGLFPPPEEPSAAPTSPERKVLVATGGRFLEKTVHDALQKGDLESAMEALDRIEDRPEPEGSPCLRRLVSDLLSRDRMEGETSSERRRAATRLGRRALMALARRNDPQALKILEAILEGDKVLFDETPFGPQILPMGHPLVYQTLAMVLLKGSFGFEGLNVLEKYLRDQDHVLSEDRTRGLSRGSQAGDDLIRAVLKHRSGPLFLRIISKNDWVDRILAQSFHRDAPFHITAFHLHLLGPLARAGRSETLRWLLRHPELLRAVRQAPPRARARAVQSLISVYHQTPGEGDRDALASLLEETGHASAIAFFRSEISRLGRTRSLRGRVLMALGLGADPREALQARIARMTARLRSRSA